MLEVSCGSTGDTTKMGRIISRKYLHVKARLHMQFFMRFRCDFGAILHTKPAPAYPARVFSRVSLRRNAAKLAGIGKKGVFK